MSLAVAPNHCELVAPSVLLALDTQPTIPLELSVVRAAPLARVYLLLTSFNRTLWSHGDSLPQLIVWFWAQENPHLSVRAFFSPVLVLSGLATVRPDHERGGPIEPLNDLSNAEVNRVVAE